MLLHLCIAILHASCCIHEVAGVLAAVYVILYAYFQKKTILCACCMCSAIRVMFGSVTLSMYCWMFDIVCVLLEL